MIQEHLGNGYFRVTLKANGQEHLFVCKKEDIISNASKILRGDA